MKCVKIRLDSVDDIKSFVNILSQFNGYFDLVSGRYVVDAKSVMGIFSMDLSRDLELNMLDTNEKDAEIMEALQPFVVTE